MHKCINNSVGNVYHLEQFVSDFFPYSQKQLGFDKPATIRFESDQDNAGVMLGKTAYYDPEAMEVVLYTDGRHPKDVMRSLSHELVHHAQNCRGDFTGQNNTGPGYAQEDPHLRKMEQEAYTKGNLIFRDYEDLIKTGKINIEIDFSDSGEPKMSLKEWKNDEINTKLMKKWGLIKEDSGAEEYQHAADNIRDDEKHIKNLKRDEEDDEKELEEGHEHGPECGCPGQELEEGGMSYRDEDDLEENAEKWSKMANAPEDPTDAPEAWGLQKAKTKKSGNWGQKVRGGRPVPKAAGSRSADQSAGSKNALGTQTWGENQRISVKEAKQITRRIIERIRKEGK